MAPGTEIDGRKIRVDYSITQRAHTPTPGVYLGRPSEWVVDIDIYYCNDGIYVCSWFCTHSVSVVSFVLYGEFV